MARPNRNLIGGLLGAATAIAAAVPIPPCAGGACASCAACLGLGAALAPALVLGAVVVSRRRARPVRDGGGHGITTAAEAADHEEVPR